MAILDKKKLGALVDKNAKKGPPPKKAGGGPPKPPKPEPEDHHDDGGGDDGSGDGGDDHDEAHDKQIAEQQAARIANGNGDDELQQFAGDLEVNDDGTAPAPDWASDLDIWERAEKAVSELSDVDDADKGLLLVHVYQALGGELNDGDGDEGDGGGEDADIEPGDEDELPDPGDDY